MEIKQFKKLKNEVEEVLSKNGILHTHSLLLGEHETHREIIRNCPACKILRGFNFLKDKTKTN